MLNVVFNRPKKHPDSLGMLGVIAKKYEKSYTSHADSGEIILQY